MTCPHCGNNLNAHVCMDGPVDQKPSEGDIMICAHCGNVLCMGAAGVPNPITMDDLKGLDRFTLIQLCFAKAQITGQPLPLVLTGA